MIEESKLNIIVQTKNNIFHVKKEDVKYVVDDDGYLNETIIGDGYISFSSIKDGKQFVYVNGKLHILRGGNVITHYPDLFGEM